MVRTTGARRQTYDVVSNRAVEVDRAIGLRARVHKPRNISLGVNVNKVHLKVMLIAKRMQIGSGFFESQQTCHQKRLFFFHGTLLSFLLCWRRPS
jgi:hypothetical protein